MLFSSIFAVAAVLATSASAAVLARNKHVADFRIYGEAGCYAKNLGVWTVIDDDIQDNPCTIFHDHVESVTVIDIIDGCKREIRPSRASLLRSGHVTNWISARLCR